MEKVQYMGRLFEEKGTRIKSTPTEKDISLYREVLSICPGMSTVIRYIKQIEPAAYGEYTKLFKEICFIQQMQPSAYEASKQSFGNTNICNNRIQKLFIRLFDLRIKNVLILALKYHKSSRFDLEDTFQTGCIGLIFSIMSYDNWSNNGFATYSSNCIKHLIEETIAISEPICPFPIDVRHKLMSSELYISKLSACEKDDLIYNRSFVEEISKKIKCSELISLQYTSLMIGPISLEDLVKTEDILLSNDRFQEDITTNPSILVDDIINSINAIPDLRAQRIIIERYGFNGNIRTLCQIGEEFRLSRERVRQIENIAKKHLARSLKEYKVGREKRLLNDKRIRRTNNSSSFIEAKPLSKKSGGLNNTSLIKLYPYEFQIWLRKHHVTYSQSWKVYCAFLDGSYYSKSFLSNGIGLFDHHDFDSLHNAFIELMSDGSGFKSYNSNSFDIIDEYTYLFYSFVWSLLTDEDPQKKEERNQRAESLKKFISTEMLSYIDERKKGGTIWIIGNLSIEESIKWIEQKTHVTFRFNKCGPKKHNAWWAMNI